MSDRIYKVLKKSAPEQAAIFYKANIRTIDSYCSSVAKIGSHFYGISPDFSSDGDMLEDQINAEVYPFILKHRDNPAIKILAGTDSFDQFPVALFVEPILKNSTIAEPLDFEAIFRRQVAEIVSAWKENANGFKNTFDIFAQSVCEFAGNTNSATYKNTFEAIQKNMLPPPPALSEDEVWECGSDTTERLAAFLRIANVLQKIKKPGNLKGADEWGELIDEMKNLFGVLMSLYVYVSGFFIIKELIPLFVEERFFKRRIIIIFRLPAGKARVAVEHYKPLFYGLS